MARAIFIGGTGSNVGKSWMTTAFCRLLSFRGLRVAPFKAQNMSNNSYPCRAGGEIGRSQVSQAEACGVEPEAAMNPVLLKPFGDSRSQVILHGQVWKTLDARDYFRHTDYLREQALLAYEDLASRFDVIVMEGAGSIAELNLADRDFVNMSMAEAAGARALLVGDIERGGIFASLLGTLDLLPAAYRKRVQAFAVNRFRGDRSLFASGVSILRERSGIDCLGVFPYAQGLALDAEDSLSDMPARSGQPRPRIGIVRFPRISNTTDFRLLGDADWIDEPSREEYDFVILPGTKSTLEDLRWLRTTGLDMWTIEQHRRGASVIGICGGYQMLGSRIDDEIGADGSEGSAAGLGLLPVRTTMLPEKTTLLRSARSAGGCEFNAYEIHMGNTLGPSGFPRFATLDDESAEGIRHGRVMGTYLHGCFESPGVVEEIFGFTPEPTLSKAAAYDALARWLESNADAEVLARLVD